MFLLFKLIWMDYAWRMYIDKYANNKYIDWLATIREISYKQGASSTAYNEP